MISASKILLVACLVTVAAVSCEPVERPPLQPTGIAVFHRSGQTFITWDERTDIQEEQYRIYRHDQPVTESTIDTAGLLAVLPEGTSIFHTERRRAEDFPPDENCGYESLTNYIITPLGDQLADTRGLFVWTADTAGTAYYAVTTVHDGGENNADFGSGNTYGPVEETPEDPVPVLVWESASGHERVYTRFMDYSRWNPTFDSPDGPTYAYNYFVGLPPDEACADPQPESLPLVVSLPGYPARYNVLHYYCAVEICCDDPGRSWYYGYSATHDYSQTEEQVTEGPIVNFTEQRILRTVYDTINDPRYSIDTQRIYAYGHSMGGSGALALGTRYPAVFSAVYCMEPMTNYREASTGSATDWMALALEPLWGSVEQNLPVENRGIYAQDLIEYNGTGVWDWQNHQQQLDVRAADEMAFVALSHGTLDEVIAWESQGQPAYAPFHLSRRAFSGEIVEQEHTWLGFVGLGPTVKETWGGRGWGPFFGFEMLRDETVPGLSYGSESLPVPPDTTGGYNLGVEWSSSWNPWDEPPVDTASQWSISLRTTDNDTHTVDITPRRLQNLTIIPEASYIWENRQVENSLLVASDTVVADKYGLVTVPDFIITPEGNRLRIMLDE